MENQSLPENGASVRFRRADESTWRQGEYDSQNQLFIEIYAPETITHNHTDIAEWEHMDIS